MDSDNTWVITAVLAVSSFLSPIAVSIINNHHNVKIRKLELKRHIVDKQLNIYYIDKQKAFANFLHTAGNILYNTDDTSSLNSLYSTAHNAILFCTKENRENILSFLKYLTQLSSFDSEALEGFNKQLATISASLNAELMETASEVMKHSYDSKK